MKRFFTTVCLLIFCSVLSVNAEVLTEENNYLKISREEKTLKSRLSARYIGYEYTLENIYSEPVTIKSLQLWNDSNGTVAYLSVQKTGKQVKQEVWQKGKAKALPTLSLSMVSAAASMPFALSKNSVADKKAKSESIEFDKPNIQDYSIEQGKKLKFRTLAIKKHTPVLRMTFINPLTDESMVMVLK